MNEEIQNFAEWLSTKGYLNKLEPDYIYKKDEDITYEIGIPLEVDDVLIEYISSTGENVQF